MTNHVPLVTTPERPNSLVAGLGRLHNDCARWVHVRQRRTGHVWQNRLFSCPLSESHSAEVLRYVELNLVRPKLVRQARDWQCSSARARIEGEDPNQRIARADLHPSGVAWTQVLEQGWKAAEIPTRAMAPATRDHPTDFWKTGLRYCHALLWAQPTRIFRILLVRYGIQIEWSSVPFVSPASYLQRKPRPSQPLPSLETRDDCIERLRNELPRYYGNP